MLAQLSRGTCGLIVALGALVILPGCGGVAPDDEVNTAELASGNGATSGSHFNLNIIGVSNEKTADMNDHHGHAMFVKEEGQTKVLLSEGDFQVLDANGTDGTAAFCLPNADPEGDGLTAYSVYARALGQPGNSSAITPCATDGITGDEYCSVYSTILVRGTGPSKFTNVSRDLLQVCGYIDEDESLDCYALFSDDMEDYYWEYDNNGLKLAQFRFYKVPTDLN